MANDQDKAGQQGGAAQTNPGSFANDREKASETGQKGGQMPGGKSEDQQTGQGSGGNLKEDNPQRAGGGIQHGGQGGHTSGSKSDREQGMDEGSQAIQDEDSGMTEDNR